MAKFVGFVIPRGPWEVQATLLTLACSCEPSEPKLEALVTSSSSQRTEGRGAVGASLGLSVRHEAPAVRFKMASPEIWSSWPLREVAQHCPEAALKATTHFAWQPQARTTQSVAEAADGCCVA